MRAPMSSPSNAKNDQQLHAGIFIRFCTDVLYRLRFLYRFPYYVPNSMMVIKITRMVGGIVGGTGYTGVELRMLATSECGCHALLKI